MRDRPLDPWVRGNSSINPHNFFKNNIPCFEFGAFILLDTAIDLYLAHTIHTSSLYDSWHKNQDYLNKACKIAGTNIDADYDLCNEDKWNILQELGEPPEACYNLYFITIYNETEEKIVYIGKTDSQKNRFTNGHLAALKLHNPKYSNYNKRIYFATITFLSKENEYIPLEFITPFSKAKKYLSNCEGLLISHFKPELNIKSESTGDMSNLILHIQNFSSNTDFLNDHFIYGDCEV